MRLLTIYPALLRAYWERALVYRAVFVVSVMSAMFPLALMAIWIGMAQDGPMAGLNAGDFAGYYLAAILVRRLTGVSTVQETENMVRTGNLSGYLLKPLGVIHHIMARTLMERILMVAILLAPVAVGVLAAPGRQFNLQWGNLALFASACALGFLFEFYAQFAIGGLSFWLVQIYGMNAVFVFVKSFLGGYIVPLALMPAPLERALRWLPFQSGVALPVEILTGLAPPDQIIFGLAISAVWTALAAGFAWLVWRQGLRSYSAVGA